MRLARRLELGLETIDLLLEVVDQPERRGVERALVVGERLDVPAHELAENGLDGCPEAAADSGTEAQRAICGDRPQPLGLGARDAPLVLVAATRARIGAGSADLLAKRPEELLDVDGALAETPAESPFLASSEGIAAFYPGHRIGRIGQ